MVENGEMDDVTNVTHDELIARGGRYAELFTLQAVAYLDSRVPQPER